MKEVKSAHNEYGWSSRRVYSSPGKIEKSLSSIMWQLTDSMFKRLQELYEFSTKEEFIDSIVERIKKKQITQ